MLTIEREVRFDRETAARFTAIYEVSFPPWERDEASALIATIQAEERLCYLARKDGAVIGIAVALALDGPSVAFLEYLAVDPEARGGGVGGKLLAHLASRLGADAGGALGLVLEVEPPGEVEGAERELRERRIAFYLRHGAAVVACAPRYRAPDLEHDGETLAFTLLWVPLHEGSPSELAGGLLHDCVAAILTQSYGLDPGDALVADVLGALAC
jgi:ribosomal protein S18 acetylase RimI-like enzyme